MIEVAAFKCEYCDKIYKLKPSCAGHERRCFANPKRKACRTCKNAIKDSDTVYVRPQGDENYGDSDYDIEFTICKITNQYLSHPTESCHFEYDCKYYKEGEKIF